jgi:hypothetical protein
MSVSSEVHRTLVKSPPELWAELSDPASLASHLGELGEIRIVRTVPETTVEWEAPDATGRVQIKPSAWGTKVTLTATQELPRPATEPLPERVEAQSTTESGAETAACPGNLPAPYPGSQLDAGPPALDAGGGSPERALSRGTLDLVSVGKVEAGSGHPPIADGEIESGAPESELEQAGSGTAGDLPAPEPARGQRLFARAWRRLRRRRSVNVPPGSVESRGSADGPPAPEASAVAPDQPSPEISVAEPGAGQFEPAPSALPAGHSTAAAGVSPQPGAGSDALEDETTEAPSAQAAGLSPQPSARSDPLEGATAEAPSVRAAGVSPEPGAVERLAGDHVTAVLTSVLDRLGAAHHRPFSRG